MRICAPIRLSVSRTFNSLEPGKTPALGAAVFGPPSMYPSGPLADDVRLAPGTHYGWFKLCNEGNARVYGTDHGVKTVAFIGFSDAYGEGWYKEFVKAAELKKLQIISNERFSRTDTSVTGQALKIMAAKPDAVLIAGGAWSDNIAATAGCTLDVVPQRGQIAHLGVDDPTVASWPVVAPLAHHYFLAFPGRVVVGATRELGVGHDARLTASGVQQVLSDALGVAPGLADATLLEVRVGLRPLATRGYPHLGEIPGRERLFVATGHGASGLTLGPWSGWAVAGAALGDDRDTETLDRFRPDPSR